MSHRISKWSIIRVFIRLAGILLAGCSLLPIPAATRPTLAHQIALQPCQLSTPGLPARTSALCGSLPVPEDRLNPTGRQINLHLAVLPASNSKPASDAVFLLAGGPGQAASEAFVPILPVFSQIQKDRDIVLLDQRGTGASNPLRCPAAPGQPDLFDPAASPQQTAAQIQACLSRLDGDPRFYTTQEAIQDLEAVRQALGYASLDLVGVSYGTRVALAYLRQYPTTARLAVLDGVTPMDWPLGPTQPASAQRAIDLIFARCTADPACQASFPDPPADLQLLLDRLDRQPATLSLLDPTSGDPVEVTLTRQDAASTIVNLSYTPENVALLPLLIHTAGSGGNDAPLAAQSLLIQSEVGGTISDGMYLSVICAEDVPFFPAGASPTQSYLPDGTAQQKQACQSWPHASLPPGFRQPVTSKAPVLLLSGEADPITPPENAAQAARTLMNSLQLVAPGMGHNNIFRGCIPRLVAEFIQSGSLAGLKTQCVNQIQPAPFFVNFAGPTP